MNVEEVLKDVTGLGKEIGISCDRLETLVNDFLDLIVSDPSNIVVYNTITTNQYEERERRILFYMWGRLTG